MTSQAELLVFGKFASGSWCSFGEAFLEQKNISFWETFYKEIKAEIFLSKHAHDHFFERGVQNSVRRATYAHSGQYIVYSI